MKSIELLIKDYKKTKTNNNWYFKSIKELSIHNELIDCITKYGLRKDYEILNLIKNSLKDDDYVQSQIQAVELVSNNNYRELEKILDTKTNEKNYQLQTDIIGLMGSHKIDKLYKNLILHIDNRFHEIHNTLLSTLSLYYKKELIQDKKYYKVIILKLINLIKQDYPEGTNFTFDCRIDAIELLGEIATKDDISVIELLQQIAKKGVPFKSFWHRYRRNNVNGKIESKEALEKILKRELKDL